MSQCPVRAVPRRMLRLKDVAGPQRTRVTVHSHITVKLTGYQVGTAVQQLRDARRRIRDERDEGDQPS